MVRRAAIAVLLAAGTAQGVALAAPQPADAAQARAASAKKVVSIARGELSRGVREVPDGSNRGTRIRMYGQSTTPRFYPAPWCAYFVSWVARRAGRPLGPAGRGFGYVPYIKAWAQSTGRWRRTPRSGDLVMFPQHVGLVESVYKNGTLTTIEGNSSNRVARRWRRWREASGYVRFASGGTVTRPPRRPAKPKPVRQRLVARISVYPSRTVATGQRVGFSANDSSGDIVRYRWDLDGDGRFDDKRGDNAERVYTRPGVVRVGLQVTDRRGTRKTARVRLTVRRNQAPEARLVLPEAAPVHARVVAHADESRDIDGRIVKYEWDMDGDGQWEAGDDVHEARYARPGVYAVGLRVTDDAGAVTETVRTIRITHRAPTARVSGPSRAYLGQPVTFDGSRSSDPDGQVTSWFWDFDGDGAVDGTESRPTWRFTVPGRQRVRMIVADEWGAQAVASRTIEVINRSPDASIGVPAQVVSGREAIFDASGSRDPDEAIATYEWDFDGDWRWDATGVTAGWRYDGSGSRKVRLRVTDPWGRSDTVSRWVTLLQPPRPRASVTTSSPVAASPVGFDASASWDPDGRIVRLEWDFDADGTVDTVTSKTSTQAWWTYAEAGEHTLALTVVDNHGLRATLELPVSVAEPG